MMMTFTLLSCGKPSGLTFSDGSSPSFSAAQATYVNLKAQVLTPYCISCHSSAATEKGLAAWIVAGDPETSLLYTEIKSGLMPKSSAPLSTSDLEMVRVYIENLGSASIPIPAPIPFPSPTPTPNLITYAQVKARILSPYGCTSCHSVSSETGLANWINVTSPSSSKFYTTVKSGSMPQGGSPLSTADKAYVLQYVKDYAASH